MIACIVGIMLFANTSAIEVTNMADDTSNDLVILLKDLHIIDSVPKGVEDKMIAIASYKELADQINDAMQYVIHVVMFFILSLLTLFTLNQTNIKKRVIYITTFILCATLSIGNEMFHGLFTDGRALEIIDIVLGLTGVLLGFLIYFLINYLKIMIKNKTFKKVTK